jgi:LacI family transcriptional regulator
LMYADPHPTSVASGKPLPLGEHNTDGLIVFTDFLDDYSIQYLHERNLPIVMLHRSPPAGLPIPKVMFENRQGAFEIVNHLIEIGRKRIVYLKGPEGNEDSRQREMGYRQALQNAGIEEDESLIGRGGFAANQAADAIRQLLLDGVEFDAVFCGDDTASIGVMDALRENGLSIPENVALVGFNDDYMSQYITPALTTVRAPIHRSGFEAAQKLLDLIEGKPVEMHSELKTELIIRESTIRESTIGGHNG